MSCWLLISLVLFQCAWMLGLIISFKIKISEECLCLIYSCLTLRMSLPYFKVISRISAGATGFTIHLAP